jgi:hypothetical protein
MTNQLARVCLVAGAAIALSVAIVPVLADNGHARVYRDGFETARTAWKQEETDATVNLLDHDRSDRAAREGRLSERFHFEAGPGSSIYYSYPLPKVPITDSLEVNLYVRSDHSGLQLFGRVVLPSDTDPDTGQPAFVLIPGSIYEATDRWQRLTLTDVRTELDRRARILRARTKRPMKLDGAYLEQLVVNLYGGPGETVTYLDDLSIAPIPEGVPDVAMEQPQPADGSAPKPNDVAIQPPRSTRASDRVALDRNRLSKDGYDWVFSAIQAPGADLKELRRYGLDVLSVDIDGDLKTTRDATKLGFLLLPDLGGMPPGGPQDDVDLLATAAAYPLRESVAFWNLGDRLGSSNDPVLREAERDRIRADITQFRHATEGISRLSTAGVVGLFPDYARLPHNLDMIGVHSQSWGTMQEIRDFEIYLSQRRDLTAVKNPGALHWAWIPATPPEEVHQAVWGPEVPPAWGIARVQPEQLRLYTYAALSAGYRGLGFRADADLTRPAGRALLIEMALLNAEIDLFESIIAQGFDPIPLLDVYPADPPIIIVYTAPGIGNQGGLNVRSAKDEKKKRPEVPAHASIRAAAVSTRDNKGKLLIVADYAPGSQWQPPQMAINDLKIRIPGAPESAQAYEISLGSVQVLDRQRVPGGIQISVPDFGPTSLILVTTDNDLVARLQQAVASVRSVAIAMAIEQAEKQLEWVSDTNGRLAADGHTIKDAADLLKTAEDTLRSARDARDREDYVMAWSEARRVGRPLRLIMRDHYQKALAELTKAVTPEVERTPPPLVRPTVVNRTKQKQEPALTKRNPPRILNPISCPPLIAFNTYPQAYLWFDWIRDAKFGSNLLPSGSFDDPNLMTTDGWRSDGYTIEGVSASISSVEGGAAGSKRALKLSVAPANQDGIDDLPPYLDHPPAALRSPEVRVAARQMVRISVKVKMSRAMPPGAGGLIVRDSMGGEPLEFRSTNAIPEWTELILYRRIPTDGALSVTLALAGFGEAFFDDLRIEPIAALGPSSSSSTAASNGRSRPAGTGVPAGPRRSPTARAPQPNRTVR